MTTGATMTGREAVASAPVNSWLRVRSAIWANPQAYALVRVTEHGLGPWLHLYDRATQEAIGEPTPQDMPLIDLGGNKARSYFLDSPVELYDGPIDPADRGGR